MNYKTLIYLACFIAVGCDLNARGDVWTDDDAILKDKHIRFNLPEDIRQNLKKIPMGKFGATEKDLTVEWLLSTLNDRLSKEQRPQRVVVYFDHRDRKVGKAIIGLSLSRFPRFSGMKQHEMISQLSNSSAEEILYILKSQVGSGTAVIGSTIIISPSF